MGPHDKAALSDLRLPRHHRRHAWGPLRRPPTRFGKWAFRLRLRNFQSTALHACKYFKKHGVCFWENRILQSGQAMCFVMISAQFKYAPGRKRKQLFGVLIGTSDPCFRLGQILQRRLLIPVLKHLRELFDDWS